MNTGLQNTVKYATADKVPILLTISSSLVAQVLGQLLKDQIHHLLLPAM